MVKKLLVMFVAIGVLASFLSALPNELAGRQNRSVEVVVDLAEASTLAEDAGMSVEQGLAFFKQSGITAVAVTETNLRRYALDGSAVLFQGGELLGAARMGEFVPPGVEALIADGRIAADFTYIFTEDAALKNKVLSRMEAVFGWQAEVLSQRQLYIVEIQADRADVERVPLGLDSRSIAMLGNLGLRLVGRPSNNFMGNENAVRGVMGEYARLPAGMLSIVIFEGTEAGGYPDYIEYAAEVMNDAGIKVGLLDMIARQRGIEQLMQLTGYRSVTVHANFPDRPAKSVVNAVAERGARLLFVRFHNMRRPAGIVEAGEFLTEIIDLLENDGYIFGAPSLIGGGGRWPALQLLAMLGVAAALLLLVHEMNYSIKRWVWAAGGFFAVGMAGLYGLRPYMALQLAAIAAAIVFPLLAVVTQQYNRLPSSGVKNPVVFALAAMLRTFAVALCGGVMVAGLNSALYFTGGAALFRGVTLMGALPFLPAAWVVYNHFVFSGGKWTLTGAVQNMNPLFKKPVLIIHVLLLSGAAVVAYVYIVRMGHQGGLALFPLEAEMRTILDYIFPVRPRTKEFLIAYPLGLLGLTLAASGRRNIFTGVLLVAGALGAMSMVNTFMHFTNPMLLSGAFLRSISGLALGVVLGIVPLLLYPVVKKWLLDRGFRDWL